MFHTLGWCMNQVAKSSWGTFCLVGRTWDSQTRRWWKDTWTNRTMGKKHRKPISLETSYNQTFAFFLSTSLFLLRRQPTPLCCGGSLAVSRRKPRPCRPRTRLWVWEVEEGKERCVCNPSLKQKMWVIFWRGFVMELSLYIHVYILIRKYSCDECEQILGWRMEILLALYGFDFFFKIK